VLHVVVTPWSKVSKARPALKYNVLGEIRPFFGDWKSGSSISRAIDKFALFADIITFHLGVMADFKWKVQAEHFASTPSEHKNSPNFLNRI
jgi:hypothetical protein